MRSTWFSHGSAGGVNLGNFWLSDLNIDAYAGDLVGWGDALRSEGDLLFYGCNLAGGSEGRALIESLRELTGADVAASIDNTGHEIFGGDWELEYAAGQIETDVAFHHRRTTELGVIC